jgi:F-type H+-transporting ATPase subunit epsilon
MTNDEWGSKAFVIRISSFNIPFEISKRLIMADTDSTSPSALRCIIVTPEATVLDMPVDFVALPLYDGEAGIAPGRAPLIGRLGYGELRVRHDNDTRRYYVDGGFVQVADNVVSVLTNRAMPADKVDPVVSAEQLSTAISRHAAGREEMAIRDRQIAQARGQLRVAGRTR